MTAPVRIERSERAARLILDRPPLQILDLELLAALDAALGELGEAPDLQLLVLAGSTPRAFSAGVSVQDHSLDKIEGMLALFHGAIAKLRGLDAFTVALVDGHCLGGGMELACACDYLIATDRARFGQPEIQLGCYPPVAAALYPRRIGAGRTLELLLTGRTLDAAEAHRLGLAHEVVPPEHLAARGGELGQAVLRWSAPVARLAKRAVRAGAERPYDAALAEAERLYVRELVRVEDLQEGLDAFLEKREPTWRHR